MNRQALRNLLSWRWIGLLVVAAVVWWADPAKIAGVMAGANLWLIAAAVALAVPLVILKGLRWQTLLAGQNVELGFREAASMYAMGMAVAAITPGRVGEFAKILALRDKGLSFGRAVAYNVLDRLLDVAFVLLAGYACAWYFYNYFASHLRVANIVVLVGLLLGAVLVSRRRLVKTVAVKLVPSRHKSAVRECWSEMVTGSVGSSFRRGATLVLWTLAAWLTWFLAVYLCGLAVGVTVSFLYLSACVAAATVVSFLPITVAGAGTRDATFILLLGHIGVARHESVALSTLVLAVFVTNTLVFYLLSILLWTRPDRPQGESGT